MDIMTHAKFHFNRLMLTLIFGIQASEPFPPPPPRAWRTTEKAGPNRVKCEYSKLDISNNIFLGEISQIVSYIFIW